MVHRSVGHEADMNKGPCIPSHNDMTNQFTPDFLEAIRLAELARIEEILGNAVPSGAKILEIGAGTGWQARELAARGYQLCAIDIPNSNHTQARIWPIIDFDGRIIPFPDQAFDVVYSSNVLEHVGDLNMINTEISRVLRPGGMAIHYVPTSAWRAWSLAVFYPALVREVFRRMRQGRADRQDTGRSSFEAPSGERRSLAAKIFRRIVPHAHGAVGSCLSELHRFQRRSWDAYFVAAGWTVVAYSVNEMFLTGDMILGGHVSTGRRKRLSHFFGSTAHLYVLKRRGEAPIR